MRYYTRGVECPECGAAAIVAVRTAESGPGAPAAVDDNDVGFTCPNGCRPTVPQAEQLLHCAVRWGRGTAPARQVS